MNVQKAIVKLGLRPLNTNLAMALVENQELRKQFMSFHRGDDMVATVQTKHIDNYMFYHGTLDGHYVLNTKYGPAKTYYKKEEYLKWRDENEFLTIVSFKHRIVYAAFHNEMVNHKLYYAIALAVDSERDSFRKRMYNWQHIYDITTYPLYGKLNQKQVKKLVNLVLADYGFDLNRVVVLDSWNQRNKKAIAHHIHVYESKLDMSTSMLLVYEFNNTDVGTVLHEIAHSVVLTEYAGWKGPIAGHGPEYCLILAELFHRYAGIPFEQTYNSMLGAKLKLAPKQDFFDGKKLPYYTRLK